MIHACPSCSATDLVPIYEATGIPAHSCLLMESRDEALAYPTGDLRLAWCGRCGFATNLAFDAGLNAYSTRYEEVQTFSPTFNAFAAELVTRLVEKRGIRGRNVIEIGCGKGEFLLELCERGDNRGVGIDPSFVPGRGEWNAGGRARFVNELYSAERHASIPADAIVCRHTLEHIAPTREFVSTLRRGIGDREDTLVFFELPDQERVYEDLAFWDVYYEHCSYFTAGSLERLFLDCGFDVLDSWRGFGDQYLLIEAVPRPLERTPRHVVQEDLAELEGKVRAFAAEVPKAIEAWRARFRGWAEGGQRAAIWGGGSKGVAFATTLGLGDELAYTVDINPHKRGFYMPGSGHRVVGPEDLRAEPPDVVVVMNAIYREEIGRQLADMGLAPEIMAV